MDKISYYGNIAYNFYFTVQFTRVLLITTRNTRDLRTGLKQRNNRTIILIGKGIGHCVTSTLAALLRTLDTDEKAAFPIWTFILVVGLHFWFNSKIELLFENRTWSNIWNYIFKSHKRKIHSTMSKTHGRSSMVSAYPSMGANVLYPRLTIPIQNNPENRILG
mmetsp:Transcript_28792/g.27570  ORF Transcript_28792/g.27570 Transcript_28792/m.27570 type:complete len:163 (+) Transcript_28792:614-1102(+)